MRAELRFVARLAAGLAVALSLGCSGEPTPMQCGPREDLVGRWRRLSDDAELELRLDATFELREGSVARVGKYLVDDRRLYLRDAGAALQTDYCVDGPRLVLPSLGGGYVQAP